ncbi:APC family permease [Pseudomonas turukhanskensis]|uniref:Amino acid permease n=1 Tax=Pseudomonas turukhanskensis TaxID=1806536 RepID=A0A9W6NEZ2_9PSED|nr:amino acid permease [Pseudomonas turukhanskensis]GLK88468.1 amino acid permease [Pseudomonas turukhanskensis]
MTTALPSGPRRHLGSLHALLVTLGMVITTDILKTAPTVALNAGEASLYPIWILGGVLSMVGALCYAEMATAFPHSGGDYHFLRTAYGERLAFLFAWSRFAVMHTGWIALMAFMFADYFLSLVPLGSLGSGPFAAALVVLLVLVNLTGLRSGFITQAGLIVLMTLGFIAIIAAGLWLAFNNVPVPTDVALPSADAEPGSVAGSSSALIFVFLAFGGWSDAATLSAELRDSRKGMFTALLGSLTFLALLYLAVNWAFIRGLGFNGLAASNAPAVDLLNHAFGPWGGAIIVGIVGVAAIAGINAMLIVGPRTTYAAARDIPLLRERARWDDSRGIPAWTIVATGAAGLLLVVFGSLSNSGFNAMVEYMTPVYWFFLALSSLALIILRRRHPDVPRPIRVPFYPVLPLLFFGLCLYMLWSSLMYVGYGALLGVGVLLLGVLVQALLTWRRADPGNVESDLS